MKLYDLTRTLRADIPVYPGTPAPHIRPARTIQCDGFAETELRVFSHVGTHIDAPAHILPGGKTLDAYAPERFFGRGMVADLSGFCPGGRVGLAMISPWERAQMHDGVDFLLFDTGYDADRNALGPYAVPDADLLQEALRCGIRAVGIDRMSIDAVGDGVLASHSLLLLQDVFIIENLKDVSLLRSKRFTVCALPLKVENADGAPARVVACVLG